MLGLPKSTEMERQLPKKLIYEKFNMTTAAKEKFDAAVSRIFITNEISPATVNTQAGETVKAIFVLNVQLKSKTFDEREILLLSKLIDQNLLFVLSYEAEIMPAVVRGKLLCSPWLPAQSFTAALTGLDLDAVWENLILQITGMELQSGNSLDEQIAENERREKLQKEIERLEKLARKEQQPTKKFELVERIRFLRNEMSNS